jgi:hypothetical protein
MEQGARSRAEIEELKAKIAEVDELKAELRALRARARAHERSVQFSAGSLWLSPQLSALSSPLVTPKPREGGSFRLNTEPLNTEHRSLRRLRRLDSIHTLRILCICRPLSLNYTVKHAASSVLSSTGVRKLC